MSSMNIAMRTLHAVENDGITPQLFSLLAKERKGSEMLSAPVVIPPTIVYERGFVKAMYTTEVSRMDGDKLIPMENEDLPRQALNMHTAISAGFRLEVKKKLGRDVITKEIYDDFVRDTREGDIVAVLMLCNYTDRDDYSGFRYLDSKGLYVFLMQTVDRPRAMLQKFVQPKGRNNTLVFAVWSPLVLVAEGRRAVHALHEYTVSPDDRGVTFESDDVRLVRDLALPRTVIDEITTTCQAIRTHVEQAERGLTLTRLACYFKIDCHSTLHLIGATSIRLQKVSRPEIRAPLDLTCGAGSPVRNKHKLEQCDIEARLANCHERQAALHAEMMRCLPRGGGSGSIVEEGRKMVDGDGKRIGSAARSRQRFDDDFDDEDKEGKRDGSRQQQQQQRATPSRASVASAASVNSAPRRAPPVGLRSALVLPDGTEFPARHSVPRSSASSSSAVAPSPSGISSTSWQRHREHMSSTAAAATATSPSPAASRQSIQSILSAGAASKASQHPLRQQRKSPSSSSRRGKPAPDAAALEEAENRMLQKAVNKQLRQTVTVIAPEDEVASLSAAASKQRQKAQTPQPSTPSSSGGNATAAASKKDNNNNSRSPSPVRKASALSAGTTSASSATPGGAQQRYKYPSAMNNGGTRLSSSSGAGGAFSPSGVNIGSSVESDLVLGALSSVPRSANAAPFSATFTRRIVQEERVSRSWYSFLSKQRQELANIISASPVLLAAPGGVGGGTSAGGSSSSILLSRHNHESAFDTSSSLCGGGTALMMNSSFSNVPAYMQQQRRTEPPPAGDTSMEFDAVTKRSLRQKHADMMMLMNHQHGGSGGGGGGSGAGGGGRSGGGGALAAEDNSLYSKSLRAAQVAYMSPARTASLILSKSNKYGGSFGKNRSNNATSPTSAPTSPPVSMTKDDSVAAAAAAAAKSASMTEQQLDLAAATQIVDTTQLPDGPSSSPFVTKLRQQQQQQGQGHENEEDDDGDDELPLDVPQLIDSDMLPTLPAIKGQADHSVALPKSVPSQIADSVVMPAVFSTRDEYQQQQADQRGKGAGAAAASSSGKRLVTAQQVHQQQQKFKTAQQLQQQQLDAADAAAKKQTIQEVLDGNIVVHEATEKMWYLRSAHPEMVETEVRRMQQQSGTAQVDNVVSFFKYVRRVVHRLRAMCRDAVRSAASSSSQTSNNTNNSVNGSNSVFAVMFELPTEFPRASISLDDISAMFQPMKCVISSRVEALSKCNSNNNSSNKDVRNLSWRELMELRISALAALDPDYYTRMFDFPQSENPATADFFVKEGTAMTLEVPLHLFSGAAAMVKRGSGENDERDHPAQQQRQELMDVLSENNETADATCGLDFLLSMETGAVGYVCLKNLPIKEKRRVVIL